jgi:transcription elongation factor Elf1
MYRCKYCGHQEGKKELLEVHLKDVHTRAMQEADYASVSLVKVACGSPGCDFRYVHPYERKPELIDIYNLAVDKAYKGELGAASGLTRPTTTSS